jgi:hypothetical protein
VRIVAPDASASSEAVTVATVTQLGCSSDLQAWTKAFTLQVTLYSRAYVPEDDW